MIEIQLVWDILTILFLICCISAVLIVCSIAIGVARLFIFGGRR